MPQSQFPWHKSEFTRATSRVRGQLQPWKIYEEHVRDQFREPNRSIRRIQSSSDIGPSILLQDVYQKDMTAAFGGRARLKDEYTLRKRFPYGGAGYLDRTYVDAKADMYPTSRMKDIHEPEYHTNVTDDHFHMYRPWRVHLPPTYASSWQNRYESGLRHNLDTSAALVEARRRDHTVEIMSGDYRHPSGWRTRFGDDSAPHVKNPWFLDSAHYNHARRGY